jgi:signal transduction histidine kinase
MSVPLSHLQVHDERGIARARQHARTIAARLGFEARDQAEIASAVCEVAGDALRLAGGAQVDFHLDGEPARSLAIRVVDHHPVEPRPDDVRLLADARRLMDGFEVDALDGVGISVAMARSLPHLATLAAPADASRIAEELVGLDPPSPADEFSRQDRELLRALDDLEARRRELAHVNRELEDTNRGVLALNVELDEQAEALRRAGEMKTRFLASVSHELRTPLSSILGLSRLLLTRTNGELSSEQDRQVNFILQSAQDLAGMVNDLLDLARIEAGREVIRLSEVRLADLFASLRGMLRPLVPSGSKVTLAFDEPNEALPTLFTDAGKLSQILRNLLSNALKFTERGEVRTRVAAGPGDSVVFSVSDTGIGIEPEHLRQIFEEFSQVDGPFRRRVKGIGLGLPLSRKLARLLGGDVAVLSEPGVGSTFSATIPTRFPSDPD